MLHAMWALSRSIIATGQVQSTYRNSCPPCTHLRRRGLGLCACMCPHLSRALTDVLLAAARGAVEGRCGVPCQVWPMRRGLCVAAPSSPSLSLKHRLHAKMQLVYNKGKAITPNAHHHPSHPTLTPSTACSSSEDLLFCNPLLYHVCLQDAGASQWQGHCRNVPQGVRRSMRASAVSSLGGAGCRVGKGLGPGL